MASGRVVFYNSQKGYGFIHPDKGGADCFVHATSVEASGMYHLMPDQHVAYDVLVARNGKISAVRLSPC